jgi:hypothetical protein
MGATYRYRCDRCGLEAETSGPWPFYRDEQDRLLMYGDPEPVSDQARRRGIHGHLASVFCLDCRTGSPVILELRGSSAPGTETGRPACFPRCGGSRLLLELDPQRPPARPAYRRRLLRARVLWSTMQPEPRRL